MGQKTPAQPEQKLTALPNTNQLMLPDSAHGINCYVQTIGFMHIIKLHQLEEQKPLKIHSIIYVITYIELWQSVSYASFSKLQDNKYNSAFVTFTQLRLWPYEMPAYFFRMLQ